MIRAAPLKDCLPGQVDNRRNGDIVFVVQALWRKLTGADVDDLIEIATEFQTIVFLQRDMLCRQQADILLLKLEHARGCRTLIENFLRIQEGGLDVRDELIAALRDFDDEVARLEEHAPA